MNKVCYSCNKKKKIELFAKKTESLDGTRNICKKCLNNKSKIYNKKYRENNKEKIAKIQKTYRQKNKNEIKEFQKKYRKSNEKKLKNYHKKYYQKHKEKIKNNSFEYRKKNKIKISIRDKKYKQKNKEKIKTYFKNNRKKINKLRRKKYNSNNVFRIRITISNLIKRGLKKQNSNKHKTQKILGCSFEFFKMYIESKFYDWMNWNNYGKYNGNFNYGWDIDHIIPVGSAKSEKEVVELNHYTNFQPLCSKINRDIKRNKIN